MEAFAGSGERTLRSTAPSAVLACGESPRPHEKSSSRTRTTPVRAEVSSYVSDTDCEIEFQGNTRTMRICAGGFCRHSTSTLAAWEDGGWRRTPGPGSSAGSTGWKPVPRKLSSIPLSSPVVINHPRSRFLQERPVPRRRLLSRACGFRDRRCRPALPLGDDSPPPDHAIHPPPPALTRPAAAASGFALVRCDSRHPLGRGLAPLGRRPGR